MSQSATNMDPALWTFMTNFRDNGDGYNFVGQCMPWVGKFRIERKNLEDFWNLYCDTLDRYDETQEDSKSTPVFLSGISERPNEYMPLLVDVDLDTKLDPEADLTQKLYTLEEAKTVAAVYRKVLKDVCRDYRARNTACFLLEKSAPYVSGEKIKGGFHIHFPRMWIRNCDHDLHIFPRVRKILNDNYPNLFSRLQMKATGDCLDPKVCSKFWLLYGGSKSEKSGSYRVTKILDLDGDESTFEEVMEGWKIYDTNDEVIKIPNDKWKHFLPRVLSIHPANRDRDIVQMKAGLEWASEVKLKTAKQRTIKHESINITESVKMARELMPMLGAWRSDGHDSWMEIGFALYDIGDASQEAFDLWVEFTKRTDRPNRDEARCLYEWNRMTKRGRFTIGTIRYYASIDNPAQYDEWKKKMSGGRIKDVLNGGHAGLAQMLHDIYANVFICADPDSGTWFNFKNHRWHRIKKAVALRKKIKEDLVPKFVEELQRLQRIGVNDSDEEAALASKQKSIKAILKNLDSAPFKENIIKECVELFHDENIDFIERLDSDINLIGFDNGVFDIGTMTFRDGKPDDYISKSVGYNYEEYTDDHPRVMEVKDFFIKVFPDIQLRRFFLEYAAQLLKGGNFNKMFLNMVGYGDNAKSVTIEMIEAALGSYAGKLPTSLITGNRTQSSGCNPELMRTVGARFITLQEPDKRDIMNVGIVKELTGNDKMYGRGLYQDGREFKPMFKLCLITNKLVRLSGDDPAIWNRILVLPFEACFPKDSSKVPKTWNEQFNSKIFHRDPNFSEKLPNMRQPLMWLLIQTLKEIMVKGQSPVPAKVSDATDKYKQNNDVFLQFTNESLMKDSNASVNLNEAYHAFQQWFRECFPNLKVPVKNELKEDLGHRWGPPDSNGRWPGYKVRSIRDSIADGSMLLVGKNKGSKLEAIDEKNELVDNEMKLNNEEFNNKIKVEIEDINIDNNEMSDEPEGKIKSLLPKPKKCSQ